MSQEKTSRNLINVTCADLILRCGYQMGKTPLLPLFAAALGAGDLFLGFIVSVSTLTGMVTKPAIGLFSDRWGRRWWLLAGTGFFVGMPFLYRFVESPDELLIIRLIHGLATAIYGPVTLAMVAEQATEYRATNLGYFGMARQAGYIIGPVAAGTLLMYTDPVGVFTLIGLISCLALVPVLLLSADRPTSRVPKRAPVGRQIVQTLRSAAYTRAIWLAGSLDFTVLLGLYAARTFLPIYALSLGLSAAMAGAFFSVQETLHLLLRAGGGRLGDRWGYSRTIAAGMGLLAAALALLAVSGSVPGLAIAAGLFGAAQALVFPSTVALASAQVGQGHVGAGMGVLGAVKNAGKVAGPLVAGALMELLDFRSMFGLLGLMTAAGAVLVWLHAQQRMAFWQRRLERRTA